MRTGLDGAEARRAGPRAHSPPPSAPHLSVSFPLPARGVCGLSSPGLALCFPQPVRFPQPCSQLDVRGFWGLASQTMSPAASQGCGAPQAAVPSGAVPVGTGRQGLCSRSRDTFGEVALSPTFVHWGCCAVGGAVVLVETLGTS